MINIYLSNRQAHESLLSMLHVLGGSTLDSRVTGSYLLERGLVRDEMLREREERASLRTRGGWSTKDVYSES